MSVSRVERSRIVASALSRCDTARLQEVAEETGYSERTLWRYRAGASVPSSRRLERLEGALGIRRTQAADVEPEL